MLCCAVPLLAQEKIPPGTVLPIELDTTLKLGRVRPGQGVHADVMETIPGTRIHRGAHVLGHVVNATPTSLSLQFDTVVVKHERIPVRTNLRAMASLMEVDLALRPESGPDRSLPPEDWTTQQVGGEQVYRGGGPVTSGLEVVGKPVDYGVLGRVRANPPCRGAVEGNDRPQALWIFSTDACGAYGYPGLRIADFGRSSPDGTIELTSSSGKVVLKSGSGLLLRVKGPP